MAQENQTLSKNTFVYGEKFYLFSSILHEHKEEESEIKPEGKIKENNKTLELSFQYFKVAAEAGNFSAKIMTICLAKFLSKPLPSFANDILKEAVRRVESNNCTVEDIRNLGFCYAYGLLDITQDDTSDEKNGYGTKNFYEVKSIYWREGSICYDGEDLIRQAAHHGDTLALHYMAIFDYANIRLLKSAAEKGSLIATQKLLKFNKYKLNQVKLTHDEEETYSNNLNSLKTEKKSVEIIQILFEFTLCAAILPDELIDIVANYAMANKLADNPKMNSSKIENYSFRNFYINFFHHSLSSPPKTTHKISSSSAISNNEESSDESSDESTEAENRSSPYI